MRKLLITRGAQGAGKTHFAERLGLGPYVVSADAIRQVTAAPVLTVSGRFGTSQEHDGRVWKQLLSNLDERMSRGELVVVDATHPSAKALAPYRKLAALHRYEVRCVDFADVPLELCVARNRERADPWFVPEGVIRKTWAACQEGEVTVPRLGWDADDAYIDEVRAFLDEPIVDLSAYEGIVHIGDLQGCFSVLRLLLDGQLHPNIFYAFVGDLCDRGDENAEVVRFALEHCERDNVAFLFGNHEEHLHRYAKGRECVSSEFELRTLPQLEAGGLTPEVVDPLCDRFRDVLRYTYTDAANETHRVMVCHAGMSTVPEEPWRVSSRQWANGVGFYAEPIDTIFDDRAPAGWVQVHGHRNVHSLPIRASKRSFNLEGKVEFGGDLRVCVLDRERGWVTRAIRNHVYRPIQRVVAAGKLRHAKSYPQWVTESMHDAPAEGAAMLGALRDHPLVFERPSTTLPHVSAFNFTREAFFDKRWDETNLRARGLFLDPDKGRIVARSYDKFFNLGERPETFLRNLLETTVYPVEVWLKENGYLGIVGFDDRTQELVVASKSSLESDFARWLREQLVQALGEGGMETLRRYLRDAQASAVFEVIEPDHDPHIVPYAERAIVLLDIIRRAERFERMDYDRLQNLGKWLGLPVKERVARLPNAKALERFVTRATEDEGLAIEGYVLEDAAGFQVKIKVPYYQFWKRMRGLVARVAKCRKTGAPLGRDLADPRVAKFVAWLDELPDETLQQSIIALRTQYLGGHAMPPRPDAKPEDDPAARGVLRALEQLAGRDIKPATAEKLLRKVLASDAAVQVLRGRPERVDLVLACPDGDTRTEAAERLNVDVD